ncbi:MAG: 30S ribosomal protein S6 [Candidatus Sungbacteria bacterium RIFCSPHIGHO2_02_FULL_52_23]|uniref:Small ribosomal subunit protein bS6 n=1 Tax=Candidatus Sungbacteria bacterium RIFCSPHIGHO2_02_FULL_52_23 TaxID=1802274 RepID=A0A1G2KXE9_9BACT|nr:MAG: 30S ribosomal protein S6 [Candidatus Sungbacteria bacterium RIFCSPHIGHO2_02_FULL_52_23]
MNEDSKNYELAYLVIPSVSEEEALAAAGKLSGILESEHGVIRHLETPKKRKLAYPIKKEKTAYFGWTTFTASPAAIAQIAKKISTDTAVLRHMIVEERVETRTPFLRPFSPRVSGTQRPIPREVEKPGEEKLDLETLDKKLEEILGK